jgi:hypothetical protein
MAINNSLLDKANAFDKNGLTKREIDIALVLLKEFRVKFLFAENPQSIEWLDPDKIFKANSGEIGEFFSYLVYSLDPFGHITIQSSNVYQNARTQINDFKYLLRVAVDKKKSLAEKVNAPWEKIGGLGQDKLIAKKIIFCFNYESGKVLPILNTSHLRHFVNKVIDKPNISRKYYSLGEEYENLMSELLLAKENLLLTKTWEITFFVKFLYASYPPPDSEKPTANPSGEGKTINVVTNEQLELRAFVKLLGELQSKGKITGEEFRVNRELWMRQQSNDRDVTVWRLKQLLNTETKPSPPRNQSDEMQKRPTRQKL